MSKAASTTIRGTVIEVGTLTTTDGALPSGAFVRLARNSGIDVVVCGLTDDEARDIASSHFMEVISITIQRSAK